MIEVTMQRAVLIITCMVLISAWGGLSALQMQRDYLPPIHNSILTVSVRAQDFDAEQLQSTIGNEIAQTVRSVDGLQDVEVDAFDGGVLTQLYFPLDADMSRAEAVTDQALAQLPLPAGVEKPNVTRVSSSSFPIMRLSLMSNGKNISDSNLRTNVQAVVAQELKSVPGVRDVRVTGAGNNGYVVTVRLPDVKAQGVSLADVRTALSSLNISWPQGNIPTDQGQVPIRVIGWQENLQDLQQLAVHRADGKSVPLARIADVTATTVNLQTISRTDGQASVLFDILKTPSSNITDVVARVNERMQNIPGLNMKDIRLVTQFNQGDQVQAALNDLFHEGLMGCLFAMISVLLFFRNLRSTVMIALSLPVCLLATTGILHLMGVSLNILTVSGLIVAMGRVVDDSIVMLDNMYRAAQEAEGQWTLSLMVGAVREMIPAILSSTATTIAVYVPIAMVGGVISAAFSGFAWSVVIALVLSFFVSVLIVPALARLWWRGQALVVTETVEPLFNRLLLWGLTRRKWVVGVALVLFVSTGVIAATFPVNFLPTNKSGNVAVQVELPDGTSLSTVDAEVKRVEAELKQNPEIATFSTSLGSTFTPQHDDVFDQSGGWIQNVSVANIAVTTKQGVDLNQFIPALRDELRNVSRNAICQVTNQSISGDDSQLRIELSGADEQTLQKTAQLIQSKLLLVPGLALDGEADQEGVPPKYHLVLNRDKLAQVGVQPEAVFQAINPYLQPTPTSMSLSALSASAAPVVLQLKTAKLTNGGDPDREVLLALAGEMIRTREGQYVPLSQLVSLVQSTGFMQVDQRDGKPFALVTGNIISPDIEKVTGQVQNLLSQLSLPAGMQISLGGISAQVKEMIYGMAMALAGSILLVLVIVSSVFRGWKAPLSVLLCIPLAFIGAVWCLWLFGKEWDLSALVGVLMLTGIVVTNGIVLVDKIERNIRAGMALRQAVLLGTRSRVRPVLMTAFTTILTVLPMSLAHGNDSVISQTLSIVVAGGMISSTLISLLLIPITYDWMMERQRRSLSKGSSQAFSGQVSV